jgi:lipopolysaccharide export system permease protein
MNLVHRHIFINVVLTCGAAVGMFAFVLMIGNALKDLLPYILAGQLAVDTTLQLIGLLVPFVVTYALPMGMLTGILLVLGRMSSDREITALRASGVSVAWLSAPILFFALLGVTAAALINFQFMPVARLAYQRELAEAVWQKPINFIVPRTFIRNFPGLVIYVGEMDGNLLRDVWVWELDKGNRVERFHHAASGLLSYDQTEDEVRLLANDSLSEIRDRKDVENYLGAYSPSRADQTPFVLSLDALSGQKTVEVKNKWLTFGQLIAKWRQLNQPDPKGPTPERAQQLMRVQITIHEKFATAFSVLSFALIAVPLGIKISRKETSANLGIGLALALGYYFATIVVGWFDNRPEFRPDLLMWLPNLAFQSLGLWMFYKVDRA